MTDWPAYRQKHYRIMKKKRVPMWKIGSWGGSWVFIWSAFVQRWSGVGGWVGGIGSRHRSFWEPVVGRILPETRIRAVHPHPPDKAHPPMDESCPPKGTRCDLSHCWWQMFLKLFHRYLIQMKWLISKLLCFPQALARLLFLICIYICIQSFYHFC